MIEALLAVLVIQAILGTFLLSQIVSLLKSRNEDNK